MSKLSDWKDFLIIGIYFAFVLAVGIASSCRKGRNSVKGYFLAGRNMHWLPIGFSLFASNIGSEHFIGLAGSGAKSGIAVVAFEWGAVLLLLMLGWLFLPIYLTSGVYTMPEYLERRFGGRRIRLYMSIISTLLYIITKISVDVFAGSVFIQQALGFNTYISITALLVVTAIYTIVGGLSAVIFTDTLQTIIMLTGSIILAVLAYVKVGGLWALEYKYPHAIPDTYDPSTNSTCGLPRDDAFHILRDPVHSDLPWPGVVIRSTFVSLWYWCTDQVIVQRTLAAKNIAHARGGTIVAGYLKILPLFLIIIPGMISRVLFTDEVACIDPAICKEVCDNESGCSNIAYPKLVLELAPVGLKGLMMAVMMSALMSSLTSIFNSAATLFTMDIWKKLRPVASDRELVISGRIFVAVLVGVSVAWIPLVKSAQGGQLFIYIQAVTGYIAPPVCSVFLLAVLIPRVNEEGAFWGILIGQLAGIVRLVLDFIYPAPGCGEIDNRPVVLSAINFTYFSAMMLVLSALITIILSFCTSQPDYDKIYGLTVWGVHKFGVKRNRLAKRRHTIIRSDSDVANGKSVFMVEKAYDTPRMSAISKEIYRSNIEDQYAEEDKMAERYQETMKISSGVSLFLNFNAILLMCVFVLCYALFA
ncbi:sodium/mannose cotransporter SLC5A10-like [Ruditapes philippinarum]|uniref:sodium/mannose cotransporter SLC5A10-like n=1 Tax=Ruditapes philippinarum TaxID=129788 RepID=UPI00295BC35B|nr:sodium/mannose cotransporter SLC5A10-like [Ruditapes philippinarum]